jgi:hypothetical protein
MIRGIPNEIEEQSPRRCSAVPAETALWFKSKMGNERLARQVKRHGIPWPRRKTELRR